MFVQEVGALRFGLFARPDIAEALGAVARPEAVSALTFVRPVERREDGVFPGDDGCPLPAAHRRFGHEVRTAAVGLDLAARSEQVVFAPVLAARGRPVTQVSVEGWDVEEPVFLAVRADQLKARALALLAARIRAALAA